MLPFGLGEQATGWLQVERRTLKLPRWQAHGMRVAFLSDFHAMTIPRTMNGERAIEMAIAEKPDLVVLGGDYMNQVDKFRLHMLHRLLSKFGGAPCPVVAVLGNHDYWSEDIHPIIDAFAQTNVRLLRNEAVDFEGVVVGGVDDGLAGKQRPDFLRSFEDRDSVLAVYHEPDYVDQLPANTSLMLAGHSHGGQICLPGGISIHTPRGARRYIRGFYPKAPLPLYVTRGVGTVGFDCRIFCNPEVSILTLEKA